MEIFKGIAASKGIGSGIIFVIPRKEIVSIPKKTCTKDEIEKEWISFNAAIDLVKQDISKLTDSDNDSQAAIANAYLEMLSDQVFIDEIYAYSISELCNVEFAAKFKTDQMTAQLEQSGDTYLKERANDVKDIFSKVHDKYHNKPHLQFSDIPKHSIIVAKELNTSDAMLLAKQNITGLIIEMAAQNSHIGILSRNYGIPAVFGIKDIDQKVSNGQSAIIDGGLGSLICDPNEKVTTNYTKQLILQEKQDRVLEKYRERKTVTKDGIKIQLLANIGSIEDAKEALKEGAAGIGLFRTEFLFMEILKEAKEKGISDIQALSEEAQFNIYKELLTLMGDRPVTIRTLDAGGDKIIPLQGLQFDSEKNPLLGFRAIRLCLKNMDLFKTQLRALYRASSFGNLKIMLPLITDPEQLLKVQEITESIKADLRSEGITINENTQLGIMVETAAAAVLADFFAEYSDFFSIGTNDLTQYTLGIDRENPAVADMFNELHPAVLRLIKRTVICGKKTSLQVSVCGEMAGNPETVLALLGLGVRSLSMAPKNITRIKELISRYTIEETKQMMESAMRLQSTAEIRNFISNFARVI